MTTSSSTATAVPAPFDPRPRLVLFDLDDTLCDYDGALLTRLRYAFEPHLRDAERLEMAIEAALGAPTFDGSEHFHEIFARHGVDDPAAVEDARARFIEDRYRGLRLFDEAHAVIAAVAQVAAIGMITNGPTDIQWPKIRLLDIEDLFPVIVVSEDVGVWKPDPRIFEIALEACGFAPADAMYVGDSVHHDIPGAHAAGLRAVWMNRSRLDWPGVRKPDAIIHSLHGILPLLGLEPLE